MKEGVLKLSVSILVGTERRTTRRRGITKTWEWISVSLLPSSGSVESNYFPLGWERENGLQQPVVRVWNKYNSNTFAWFLRLLTLYYYTLIGKVFPGHMSTALSIYFICNTEQTAMDFKEHNTP